MPDGAGDTHGDGGDSFALTPARHASVARADEDESMHDIVEFRGSYLYATEKVLDAALATARERFAGERYEPDARWTECFTREQATLHVHANLPDDASEVFTVCVLRTLASTALQGAIEARRDGRTHEYYFVESLAQRD